tara:strand:+ start:8468 stop:9112 length:645 start_codon:yes stop_codon:yes gene_type:complete
MSIVKNMFKGYREKDFQFDMHIEHLEWEDSGITALRGPSGSGKSTFFRLLLGLEPCPGMEWWLNEKNLADLPVAQRQLGVVFQTYELFPHMTARQNILFAGKARGQNAKATEARMLELSDQLEIRENLDQSAQNLSGGQKQRVALIRAMVAPIQYLFLDEPFSALDSDLRDSARKMVGELVEREKIPTLLVTHDEQDVQALAHRELKIENGRIL